MNPVATVCPECGSDLPRETSAPCSNPDCPSMVRSRIAHWCAPDVMNIRISEALINRLVARGLLLDVADLYRLRPSELLQFEDINKSSAETLLSDIDASRSQDWSHVLHGLGIPNIDAEVSSSLARRFRSIEEVVKASREHLTASNDVTLVMAESLTRWFSDPQHRKLIKRLRQAGFTLG